MSGEPLDRARWRRIDDLLARALELPPEERRRFLERASGDDVALAREVETLLACDRDDGFLETGLGARAAGLLLSEPTADLRGRRVGRFTIEERLGAGGMGEVYVGRDLQLERPVAIKVLPAHLSDRPEHRDRVRREALAASAANHPNLLTVHEVLEVDGRDVLITELVEGETLRARLAGGALSLEHALDVAIQVARGLAAAHAVGVVHRDVKPENLMVRPDGLVKVLDFGIARTARAQPEGSHDTSPGTVLGTVAYMSPEQARGEPVDARTDLWSLAVVLWEMVTGEHPFAEETHAETLAAVLTRRPGPLSRRRPGTPAALDRLVQRALAADVSERIASARAVVEELETIRRQAAERGSRAARRRPALVFGAVAAVLLALGALGSWRWSVAAGRPVDSLAVLPLVDTDGDPAADFLGDGLTDSLIRSLAEAEDLRVASREAVARYRREPAPAREVARALGVRGVLSGRLDVAPGAVTVSLELVDGRDGSHLWGETYRLTPDQLGSLHETVAGDLHRVLRRRVSGEQRSRIARLHSDDPQAFRLYLEGRFYWYKTSPADYHRSRDFFLRAIEHDPDYALAWAGLAHYYGFAAAVGMAEPDEGWRRTEQALRRIEALAPDLPEALPLRGSITLYRDRDWTRGERELAAATEAFPEALNHHSAILGLLGRVDEALEVRERELRRDPTSIRANRVLAYTLYFAGRFEEAVRQSRRTLDLAPSDVPSWEQLGDALAELGRSDEAIDAWARALQHAGDGPLAATLRADFAERGFEAAVRALAAERRRRLEARAATGEYVPAYELARASLRAGDLEAARAFAERAFDERNRLVLDMVHDPVFAPLREQSWFQEEVRSLRLPGGLAVAAAGRRSATVSFLPGPPAQGARDTRTILPVKVSATSSSRRTGSCSNPAGLISPPTTTVG